MAGHTYVTKDYSRYDAPSQEDGYDRGSKNFVRGYVVEKTTIERVRGPISGFSGSPSKFELLQEYGRMPHMFGEPKYVVQNVSPKSGDHYKGFEPRYGAQNGSPKGGDHHKGFGSNYGSNYETSIPTHHYGSNYGDSSPTRRYGPNHNTSSPTRHYEPNYENSSPTRHYEPEEPVEKFLNKLQIDTSRPTKTVNFSIPNKHGPSSPTNNYGSEGGPINKNGSFPGRKNNWQSAGPPPTRHPLTNPTNDINEALSFLDESVNHSGKSGPKKGGGVLDDMSTLVQPTEPTKRYSKPIFGRKSNNTHYNNASEDAIDSDKALWKYRGSRVP